jgi:hypothetical protein
MKKPHNASGQELTNDIYPVLFSSPAPPNSDPTEGFDEGSEVHIWRPWYSVELPDPGIHISCGVGDGKMEQAQSFEDAGAQWEVNRSKHALLCSRFFVLKS